MTKDAETLPEFVAQFVFIMLLSGVMFLIGFVFRPESQKVRARRAAHGGMRRRTRIVRAVRARRLRAAERRAARRAQRMARRQA